MSGLHSSLIAAFTRNVQGVGSGRAATTRCPRASEGITRGHQGPRAQRFRAGAVDAPDGVCDGVNRVKPAFGAAFETHW